MQWSPEAENAVKAVPFFVRKRVRARVEESVRAAGRHRVSIADVKNAKQRFLNKMAQEVKGYRLENCFGTGGCPHRVRDSAVLLANIEKVLREADLLEFLKSRVGEDIKFHHEFRVALADCPNACSQPQIKDIAIIGAAVLQVGPAACSGCEACVDICREQALELAATRQPVQDPDRCVHCGQCVDVCPDETLVLAQKGYRVQVGGKLGRHPQLARELPGIFNEEQVVRMVRQVIGYYKTNSRHGERLGELLDDDGWQRLKKILQVNE